MNAPRFGTEGQQTSIPPFVTTVRKIIDHQDGRYASFNGKSSLYEMPAHLVELIERAAQERRTIAITTDRNEASGLLRVLTVELLSFQTGTEKS